MLHPQLAWYIAGPALGLCVVACRALFNARLGVTGGYSEVVARLRGIARGDVESPGGDAIGGWPGGHSPGLALLDWRGWLMIGVLLGGTVFALVAGGPDFHGYGWLSADLRVPRIVVGAVLLGAGVLIGYGAKLAGGCTSGNGLSGTSLLSPAALAATATFFATAIAVSFVIKAVV